MKQDSYTQGAARFQIKPLYVFGLAWVLLVVLYLPAARAGFVSDFTGWLNEVKNHPFWDYINRTGFDGHSLYQVTQFVTYVFYKLFGINPWLWHLLHITLHALNCALLYTLCSRLLIDAGVKRSATTALCGVVLYCLSPYLSEVVVWEASFHYLIGLLFILSILVLVQQYHYQPRGGYIWLCAFIYLLSSFSIEIFYITPWLIIFLGAYYFYLKPGMFKNICRYFFLPMLLIFAAHLLLYHMVYGGWVAHIGTATVTGIKLSSFGKPAKYLFHILLLGRFFSEQVRHRVYDVCDTLRGVVVFYAIVIASLAIIVARFRKMGGAWKAASLLWVWTLITLGILVPLWFYDSFLVITDRYIYFTNAFLYMLVVVTLSTISIKYLRWGVFAVFSLANLRFAIQVNRYWWKSECIITHLLNDLPASNGKTTILLNIPGLMHGVQMIGATKDNEYALMHTLLLPEKKLQGKVYDGVGYNMLTPDDGAHVNVINDSTVRVTLNQWGTWWWYNGFGAGSYENEDYKVNMIDGGHFYELTVKKPADRYMLLYQVGEQWKVVNWNRKQDDQN